MRFSWRRKDTTGWHRWFAWYPKVLKFGPRRRVFVWLENIERFWFDDRSKSGANDKSHWIYRLPGTKELSDAPDH